MPSDSRDYFREERPFRFESWGGTPVTWGLILALAILWLVYAGTVNRIAPGGAVHEVFHEYLSLTPDYVLEKGRVWQVATYAFLHTPYQVMPALWSLLFLFFSGRPLERWLGRGPYLRLFLAGGVFCGILAIPWLHLVGAADVAIPTASGAVYAVTIGYLLRWPNDAQFFGVPGWGVAVFLVVLHLALMAVIPQGEIWSFFPIAGAGFAWLHLRARPRWEAFLDRVVEGRRARHAAREAEAQQALRRRLDELLAKIESAGIGSLSSREKDFLQQASKRFREPG